LFNNVIQTGLEIQRGGFEKRVKTFGWQLLVMFLLGRKGNRQESKFEGMEGNIS
jgi:hypothetical protein